MMPLRIAPVFGIVSQRLLQSCANEKDASCSFVIKMSNVEERKAGVQGDIVMKRFVLVASLGLSFATPLMAQEGKLLIYTSQPQSDAQQTIDAFSVVSSQVAKEMAIGVQKLMKSDYAIATTGNAGPSKGDADATIGTVFIALATPNEVFVEEFNFGQPREKVIDRAVNKAFEILQKEILKNL